MWRRRKDNLKRRMMSGILACLLVATSLTNTVGIITSFAGETANIPRVSYKYDDLKNDKGQLDKMVQINVQAENESFTPGSEMVLKVYVQNLSDQNLTGGSLKWSGKGLEEAGFLDEEEEDLFNGPGWDGEVNDSDTSDLMEELGNFSVTGLRKSVALKIDDTAAKDETEAPEENVEIITDVETEEEEDDISDPQTDEEGKRIRGIELAPGEVYETRFYGTVEDMDSIVTRKVTFEFLAGTDDNKVAQDKAEFTYNTGMALVLPIEFDDGPALMTNELNTMYIHTRFEDEKILDEYTWDITDEDEATPSDAERHEITVATMSNGTEDSSEGTTPANMKYSIVTYGAKLEGIEAWYDDERNGWGEMTTGVSFRVKDDTEPGVYFGQVTTSIRREGKSYKTTQGFHFFVLGDGQLVLKGNINGAEIQVKGDRSSFPEGDMLSLKVTEVPAEKMDLVQEAMVQKAEELGVSVDKMKAMDIKVIADGVEQELEGEVEVTFSNLTLEKVEETIGLEDEENIEDGEVEELEEINTNAVFGLRKASAGTEEDQADAAGEGEMAEAENESEGEEKEEATLAVWHLDEEAGVMNEMDSEVNGDGDVVMATEHFSIFILVELENAYGLINITLEHWGTIETLASWNGNSINPNVDPQANARTASDNIFNIAASDINNLPQKNRIATTTKQLEIYASDTISLRSSYKDIEELSKVALAAVKEVNNGKEIKNYSIEKIWVTQNKNNLGKEQWVNETYQEIVNDSNKHEIKLTNDSIVRIWYVENGSSGDEALWYENDVTFYDYNISDGYLYTKDGKDKISAGKLHNKVTKDGKIYQYIKTEGKGTNSQIVGQSGPIMGAGQNSSGNRSKWNNNTLSVIFPGDVEKNLMLNAAPGSGEKIITNLVQNRLENGALVFNTAMKHAKFFEEVHSGNTYYTKLFKDGYKLKFRQQGDTYTLRYVTKEGENGQSIPLTGNLEEFSRYNDNVAANNFWPLDKVNAYEGMDPFFSLNSPDGIFCTSGYPRIAGSDDGGYHNWHFGMRYDFEFRIGDYTGPLNYYFRGDDDFWLFIDDEKVVDIGGIHLASGQSVDLRKWFEGNDPVAGTGASPELRRIFQTDKNHVYHGTVYFMERGGHGSCCYMKFTLPNYKQVPIVPPETIDLEVTKIWDDYQNEHRPNSITLNLLRNGTLIDTVIMEGTGDRWSYRWEGLEKANPKSGEDYTYTITEEIPPGYGDPTIKGPIKINGETIGFEIVNSLNPAVNVKVTKVWEDDGCDDRPDEIVFQLMADGEPYESRKLSLTAKVATEDEDSVWEGTFENLPMYRSLYDASGNYIGFRKIEYTVVELDGSGANERELKLNDKLTGKHGNNDFYKYTLTKIDQNADLTDEEIKNNYVAHAEFTNSHTHELQVTKQWSGGEEPRPEVKIGLYELQEDRWVPIATAGVQTLSVANKNTYTYTGLYAGKEYTVKELRIAGATETAEFTENSIGYIGLDEGGIYNNVYSVSYSEKIKQDGHDCHQSMVITNTYRNIETRLRIAKSIDNIGDYSEKVQLDLKEDDFIVQVERTDKADFETGLVLQHAGTGSELSGYVEKKISGYLSMMSNGDNNITLNITETVPKEYFQADSDQLDENKRSVFLTIIKCNDKDATSSGNIVTLEPGADVVVVVHNRFIHEDYFHNDDREPNKFTGENKPITPPRPDEMPTTDMSAVFLPGVEEEWRREEEERLL